MFYAHLIPECNETTNDDKPFSKSADLETRRSQRNPSSSQSYSRYSSGFNLIKRLVAQT
jgi:hypothetical protein